MNIKNRRRLLSLAKLLDKWAMRLRIVVKNGTPKRSKKVTP